jgi:hypothetical protein
MRTPARIAILRFPSLAVDFADYAAWQASKPAGPELEALLTFWKDRLADLPTLHLPMDFVRHRCSPFGGALRRTTYRLRRSPRSNPLVANVTRQSS